MVKTAIFAALSYKLPTLFASNSYKLFQSHLAPASMVANFLV